MINQEDLYTSLEDSKLIAPVMEGQGIGADKYWGWSDICEEWLLEDSPMDIDCPKDNSIPSFRLDKILLALPEWVFSKGEWHDYEFFGYSGFNFKFDRKIESHATLSTALINFRSLRSRGKEALKAGCELIALLESNGLGREEV